MHKVQMYENLRDMLEQEINKIQSKGELDPQSLDNLNKLMATVKNVDKCLEREQGMSGRSYGRSMESYGRNSRGSYDSYGGSYDSYGRGGDSRGSYGDSYDSYGNSRDNFRDNSFRGGSYGQSYEYSRDNKPLMQRLEAMMSEARNESDRQAIKDYISRM